MNYTNYNQKTALKNFYVDSFYTWFNDFLTLDRYCEYMNEFTGQDRDRVYWQGVINRGRCLANIESARRGVFSKLALCNRLNKTRFNGRLLREHSA